MILVDPSHAVRILFKALECPLQTSARRYFVDNVEQV